MALRGVWSDLEFPLQFGVKTPKLRAFLDWSADWHSKSFGVPNILVQRFWTSTASHGQIDRRRDAEAPTGADFTFCAHVIIRVPNVFFNYLSQKRAEYWIQIPITSCVMYDTCLNKVCLNIISIGISWPFKRMCPWDTRSLNISCQLNARQEFKLSSIHFPSGIPSPHQFTH